jgi:hypothetical protein
LQPVTLLSTTAENGEQSGQSTLAPEFVTLQDEWGWTTPEHIERAVRRHESPATQSKRTAEHPDRLATTDSFSHTQEQIAISVDYTAWRWKCQPDWRYDGSEILEQNALDSVLYTNYDVAYEGTETDERGLSDDEYEVAFQATFSNSAGKVCDSL